MKEISVTSPLGQFAKVTLPDEKAEDYVGRHSRLGTWGKPAHWTTEPIKDAETRENEFGETEYLAPAEFTVTVTDITERLQAQEQKQTERKTKEQAEIAKLKSARPTTLPELIEIVMAMAKVVLSDKGEIDLAEDTPLPGGGGKEGKL